MKGFHRILVMGILCLFAAGCGEKRQQMVVPTANAWYANRDVLKAESESMLSVKVPKLTHGQRDAIYSVDRGMFVTSPARHRAYDDMALPIGSGQSTLKLSDIAFILSEIEIRPTDTVFELGTGTGYLTAILSRFASHVYSVEVIEYLGEIARQRMALLSLDNVKIRIADGAQGWARYAPFDVAVVTAAVSSVSPAWIAQVKVGGRLVVPLMMGDGHVEWVVYEKIDEDQTLQEKARRRSSVPPMIESSK